MNERFHDFMPFIFEWEGGYDNDPDDPGGETKYGIDKRSHPTEDIKNLTRERAREIYLAEYWNPLKCSLLPFPVGEIVMNIGVNCGKGRAAKWLQQAAGGIAVDGIIGPATVKVAWEGGDIAGRLLDRTEAHYRSIANGRLAKFLRGWLNRNDALRKFVK
jgi:lysozyme family protein